MWRLFVENEPAVQLRSESTLQTTPLSVFLGVHVVGTFFLAFLPYFTTLVLPSRRRLWENAEGRRQSLLLALFLSVLNIDINVVRVAL